MSLAVYVLVSMSGLSSFSSEYSAGAGWQVSQSQAPRRGLKKQLVIWLHLSEKRSSGYILLNFFRDHAPKPR
ncbi:hypothetical protein PQQ88_31045, partial [Paraburkholderia caledonica]|uniref:hypothetical protein n=1 Tax=Paraburkholderia caledonica TaxID=134536 RepID=UPI0038B94EF5